MGILLIEDNITISKGLQYFFEKSGFNMDISNTISNAIEKIENKKYDLIILDIALPDGNGCDFYKNYIKKTEIPTIFLTANDTEDDIVKGFDLGADDYIEKPFDLLELMARVDAQSRRINKESKNNIVVKDLMLNFDKRECTYKGELVELTVKEFEILALLMKNSPNVLTREQIFQEIWGSDQIVESRALDMHIKTLRAKLNDNGSMIKTVYGIGYKFIA